MNLDSTLRSGVGRALIAAGRHLSRTGARLLGHPSGEKVRPLRVVVGDSLPAGTPGTFTVSVNGRTSEPIPFDAPQSRLWRYNPEDTA